MTRQQLDLLIRYINVKCEIATKTAKGDGVSPYSYDALIEIVAELEESTDD